MVLIRLVGIPEEVAVAGIEAHRKLTQPAALLGIVEAGLGAIQVGVGVQCFEVKHGGIQLDSLFTGAGRP